MDSMSTTVSLEPPLAVPSQPQANSTTLYVANLPPGTTVGQLQRMFSVHGTVNSCQLAHSNGPNARLIGFVQFATADMARQSLTAMNGLVVDGWRLSVKYAEQETGRGTVATPSSNLYVANLRVDFTDAEMRALFSQFGHILSLVVFKDTQTGACKGSGMIRFSTTAEATAAIRGLHHAMLPGLERPLEVKYAESKNDRAVRPKRNPSPPDADRSGNSSSSDSAASPSSFPEIKPPMPFPSSPEPSEVHSAASSSTAEDTPLSALRHFTASMFPNPVPSEDSPSRSIWQPLASGSVPAQWSSTPAVDDAAAWFRAGVWGSLPRPNR